MLCKKCGLHLFKSQVEESPKKPVPSKPTSSKPALTDKEKMAKAKAMGASSQYKVSSEVFL